MMKWTQIIMIGIIALMLSLGGLASVVKAQNSFKKAANQTGSFFKDIFEKTTDALIKAANKTDHALRKAGNKTSEFFKKIGGQTTSTSDKEGKKPPETDRAVNK
jgi:hypothetical protein